MPSSTTTKPPPLNILVYSKTTNGYRHTSIPAALRSLQHLSTTTSLFTLHATEDSSIFTGPSLSAFQVVILLQCTGSELFAPAEISAFRSWVEGGEGGGGGRRGGGVVAIHAAAAGMPDDGDEWYGKLIGARFDMHPPPEAGDVLVEEAARGHFCLSGFTATTSPSKPTSTSAISTATSVSTSSLASTPTTTTPYATQAWTDEWYNFRTHPRSNPNLQILLRGDTNTFKGGKMGHDHPLAWCQELEEGGRSWYCALGHFDEAYADEWFMGLILRGILWVGRREAYV